MYGIEKYEILVASNDITFIPLSENRSITSKVERGHTDYGW
jgi:hypothetical protein